MTSLDHANQMFGRFLDRISDCAIFMVCREGKVTSWNAGARAIVGYDADEIVGQPLAVLFEPAAQASDEPARALAEARATGRWEREGWHRGKAERRFWASVAVTAICDDAGALAAYGVILRDLTALQQAEEKTASVIARLEKTAETDYLTGVANRRALEAFLAASLEGARRTGRPLSVAMIDLDHFKSFNDTYGHQAGDSYLREAVAAWRRVLREDTMLARYGGEEFTAVTPDAGVAQLAEAMERLRQATPPPVTCSVGVAQWDGAEGADALLHRADRRLYAAKEAGRDRVLAGEEG